MNQPTNINILLKDWGGAQQQLPPSNSVLKTNLLAKLSAGTGDAVHRKSRKLWLPLALTGFAGFAGLVFVLFTLNSAYIPTKLSEQTSYGGLNRSNQSLNSDRSFSPPAYEPPSIPINDTREYLKTDYSASIKTRRVQELADRLQTTIRGFSGRIDSANSSPSSGSISFVVPAARLDAFRTEVKAISGSRFVVEQTSSQNLLSQKQSLEQQQSQFANMLNQFENDRDQLIAAYNQTVASLQSQLDSNSKKLSALQTQWNNTADPNQKASIETQQRELRRVQSNLTTQLSNQNASHAGNLNTLDQQINETNNKLKSLKDQDSRLVDTVATVRGTISLSHISVWGILGLYLPNYWMLYVSLAAIVVAYILHRHRRSRFVIP